jgi:hypothetical protein
MPRRRPPIALQGDSPCDDLTRLPSLRGTGVWREPRTARAAGVVLFVAVLALGIWLRVQVWPPGPTSDETSILQPLSDFGAWAIVDSPEAATNPPLFRLMFALLDEPVRMYRWGRIFTGACGLLAPIVVFFTVRRAARGDTVAGAIAGAVVALNPTLAVESVSFRVYGLLAFVAAARMACLCRLADEPQVDPSRPAWLLFLMLTILLPWLHYSSLPLLGLEAVALAVLLPGHRRLLIAHVTAGVLALPAVLLLLKWRAILPPPPPSGSLLANALPLWLAGYSGGGWLTVVIGFALILFGCRRAAVPGRAVFGHALAWVGSALATASYRAIRAGSLSVAVVPLGLTLGLLGTSLPQPWRYVCHACVGIAFLFWLPASFRSDLLPVGYPNPGTASAIAFAADLQREPRPVRWQVYPPWNMGVLQFQLIAAGEARRWTQCGQATPSTCSPDQTIQLFGVESLTAPPPGRLVVLDCYSKPIGCQERGGYACAKVYECP